MLRTSALIKSRQTDYPECAYYLPLCSKARRNIRKHPDIAIETCKSVLEGVSKTVVLGLDRSITRQEIDKKDFDQIVKLAAKVLKANDDVVEDNFVTRAASLANALGSLRNVRGDISHGKAVPKLERSTDAFARLCLQMTDAITSYMLASFFETQSQITIGISNSKIQVESGKVETEFSPDGLISVRYDDFPDFNDFIDQSNPPRGKIIYSEALFQLYYEEYVIELEAFIDSKLEAEAAFEDQES